jgi:hypothetical protein
MNLIGGFGKRANPGQALAITEVETNEVAGVLLSQPQSLVRLCGCRALHTWPAWQR